MKRIKFIQRHKSYLVGDVIRISDESAEAYIKLGVAILTKDMAKADMKVKEA